VLGGSWRLPAVDSASERPCKNPEFLLPTTADVKAAGIEIGIDFQHVDTDPDSDFDTANPQLSTPNPQLGFTMKCRSGRRQGFPLPLTAFLDCNMSILREMCLAISAGGTDDTGK
jgi:hypothetical protein